MTDYNKGLKDPRTSIYIRNPIKSASLIPPKPIKYTWAQKQVISLRYKKFKGKKKLAKIIFNTITIISIPIYLAFIVLIAYLIDQVSGCSGIAGMVGIPLGILYFYLWQETRFRWFGILDDEFYGYFV